MIVLGQGLGPVGCQSATVDNLEKFVMFAIHTGHGHNHDRRSHPAPSVPAPLLPLRARWCAARRNNPVPRFVSLRYASLAELYDRSHHGLSALARAAARVAGAATRRARTVAIASPSDAAAAASAADDEGDETPWSEVIVITCGRRLSWTDGLCVGEILFREARPIPLYFHMFAPRRAVGRAARRRARRPSTVSCRSSASTPSQLDARARHSRCARGGWERGGGAVRLRDPLTSLARDRSSPMVAFYVASSQIVRELGARSFNRPTSAAEVVLAAAAPAAVGAPSPSPGVVAPLAAAPKLSVMVEMASRRV